MAEIQVKNCGQFGLVTDIDDPEMPLNAWTTTDNVRAKRNYIGNISGYSQLLDIEESCSTSIAKCNAAHYLLPIKTATQFYWVYPQDSNNDGQADQIRYWDGAATASTDISATAYAGTTADLWTGCVFNDNAVLTNNTDSPQWWDGATSTISEMVYDGANLWSDYDGAGKPYTCAGLRTYKSHLFALDITDDGTRYPTMIHWSNPAEAGGMPDSWDYTNPANSSRRVVLGDTPGYVLDALTLRDGFIIYKEDITYTCDFIGGFFSFNIAPLFRDRGIFSRECVVDIGGRHFVVDSTVVYIHDGSSKNNILEGRNADRLFGSIDPANQSLTFCAHNKEQNEVWICYPSRGSSVCDKALIYNYETQIWTERDLPSIRHIASGAEQGGVSDDWDYESSLDWDDETALNWVYRQYQPNLATFVGAGKSLYKFDDNNQALGQDISVLLQRLNLNIGGSGQWNMIQEIQPIVEGSGTIQIAVGYQRTANGPVFWEPDRDFVIGEDYKIDALSNGMFHGVKFSSSDNIDWRLTSYKIVYAPSGTES